MKNNEILKTALESLFEDRLFGTAIQMPDHVFSLRYLKRVKKLFRMQKAYENAYNNPKRLSVKKLMVAVVIFLLAIIATITGVSAIREAFLNFITEIFVEYTDIRSVTDEKSPQKFEKKYMLMSGLDNHSLIEQYESPADLVYVYDNEQSQIRFKQSIKEFYDVSVNSEGYEVERIFINGFEGFFIDMTAQNSMFMSWDNGEYIFTLSVTVKESGHIFSKNTQIVMAESVKIVE
jgi:hypothetical protein